MQRSKKAAKRSCTTRETVGPGSSRAKGHPAGSKCFSRSETVVSPVGCCAHQWGLAQGPEAPQGTAGGALIGAPGRLPRAFGSS